MPTWDDLDQFVDPADFADQVTFTLEGGAGRSFTVNAIFDDPYLNADVGEYDADASAPRLTCKAADVVDVRRYDQVLRAGVLYDVLTTPQPDGTGMAVVRLALNGDSL